MLSQALKKLFHIPKVTLGVFPTPLAKMDRLTNVLAGPDIYIKRDDLTGLALGGNKTRKLEYIIWEALDAGCNSLITAGAVQSNHCRQTAAAAAKTGMKCHLLLGGQKPSSASGNLLLNQLFGSKIHWTGEDRKGASLSDIYDQLKQEGDNPYLIPYGGSNHLGALSFAAAAQELYCQTKDLSFSHIVFASSSGGTHAGLILGRKLLNQNHALLGINIDKDNSAEGTFKSQVLGLAHQAALRVGLHETFEDCDFTLITGYDKPGYGVMGPGEDEAIRLVAQMEGILLDPVYTGRAMAGLIDLIRKGHLGKKDRVLFWHTGGIPALFDNSYNLTHTGYCI